MTGKRPGSHRSEVSDDLRFAYESEKRTTAAGRAAAALGGDVGEIKALAALGAVIMDGVARGSAPSPHVGESASWLAGILGDIAAGKEPNEAFGWRKKGRPGARSASSDFETLSRTVLLLNDARALAATLHRQTAVNAAEIVKDQWSIDLFDARAGWGGVVRRDCTKINAADARTLAAEIVANLHRVNDPANPWGRYSAGNFKALTASTLLGKMKRTNP